MLILETLEVFIVYSFLSQWYDKYKMALWEICDKPDVEHSYGPDVAEEWEEEDQKFSVFLGDAQAWGVYLRYMRLYLQKQLVSWWDDWISK